MELERIILRIPAHTRYANVVRQTASTLATVADLTIADVEDVKIAAEEGFVYAAQTVEGSDDVEITFGVKKKELVMEFLLGEAAVTDDVEEPSNVYAAFILGAVCDEYEISETDRSVLRLVKRAERSNGPR